MHYNYFVHCEMKKRSHVILKVILFVCSLFSMQSVFAACGFASTSPVQQGINITVPLVMGNITVGPDDANGSVIYRQQYQPVFATSQNLRITCDNPGVFRIYKTLPIQPMPLSSWSGSPFGGHVYETGVPGLGVAISYYGYSYAENGDPYPTSAEACGPAADNNSCDVPNGHFSFVVTIIKTGTVVPGVLNGAKLPCPRITMGTPGNEVQVVNACFGGTVNVVSKSCQTPDVFVNLGTHELNEFKGKGSASKWVNASIKLKDCPVFYGENRFGGSWSENNVYTPDRATPNQAWYSFTALQPVVDAENGIMDIDESTDNAAKGIGIQLASGTSSNAVPTLFKKGISLNLPTDGSTDITIPLVARYVQTASSANDLKPGRANGQMTFLINYY